MVTVKITETYDMKTTVNKLGIVGVHTPTVALLRRLYPGLLKNHKFVRFVKCDVVGACASVLPADPLQVGVTAGAVAPEDMFNPILYKAVTNQSFDTLVSRINGPTEVAGSGSLNATELSWGSATGQFNAYYALLSENGEYRKAMPQSGFAVRGLVPICHTLISQYGNTAPIDNLEVMNFEEGPEYVPDLTSVTVANSAISDTSVRSSAVTFRGKSVKMPKLPIHYGLENWDDIPNPDLVKTMVLALVVPPAKLHEFYYRIRVTWTVRFEGVCSTNFIGNDSVFNTNGSNAHFTSYTYSKTADDLDSNESMVDASNVDIEKIMES